MERQKRIYDSHNRQTQSRMHLNSNSKLENSLTQYKTNTQSAIKLIENPDKEEFRKENLSTAMMSKVDIKSQYSDFIDHYKKSTINLNRKFSTGI